MHYVYALTLFCSIHTVFSASVENSTSVFGTSPLKDLNFMEMAAYYGYKAEQHFVTTNDGYILGVFRIPVNKNCSTSNGTIMFTHGLYLTSDDCLIPGPKTGHCQIYADNCFDVWIPNVRGNFYSRNHTHLDPDKDSEFWNFALEELALKDLPAVIDYVSEQTGDKIIFVGHSQAVAMLLILCAKMPEYNNNIKVGFGLSPTAWLDNASFLLIQIQSGLARLYPTDSILNKEILARNGVVQYSAELLCGSTNLAYPICSAFIFAALGFNKFQITKEVLPVIVGHTPGGTSNRLFIEWGQKKNNGFCKFDYGSIKNMIKYGQISPPLYDLSPVTMRWVFFASLNDNVGNVTDVKYLESKLSNASTCVLSDEYFAHLDFIYGKDIPNYITQPILSTLKTGTYTCP